MADLMFDQGYILNHIGTDIKYRDSLSALKDLEEYLILKCKGLNIPTQHDCIAEEKYFFKTIGYTSYAGFLYIHPLSMACANTQMVEACLDNKEPVGHIDWLKNKIKFKTQSKYTLGDGTEMSKVSKEFKELVVLVGSNKFKQHTSGAKLKRLVRSKKDKLVLKPHPLTSIEVLGRLFKDKGEAYLAHPYDSVYSYMESVDVVHTTHVSETALMALLMGKKISPIDPFNTRMGGCFYPINNICFTQEDPVGTLDKAFASCKSGIVHPDVDVDWRSKIDNYLEYITRKREACKGHYYEH